MAHKMTTVHEHKRKAYHRSDGTYVHATTVPAYKRPAGHGPKNLPKPEPIKGYHVAMSRDERLKLLKHVPKTKTLKVARDLQLLANLTKHSQPGHSEKYHSDATFLFTRHQHDK